MPDENSRRHIEHAVVRIQLLNCGTTAGGIPLAKNLLKVAVQEFVNSFRHSPSPWLVSTSSGDLSLVRQLMMTGEEKLSVATPHGHVLSRRKGPLKLKHAAGAASPMATMPDKYLQRCTRL